MRTVLFINFIAIAASVSLADLCSDRSFSVTGTNFIFQFEDSELSTSNQHRIADDIITIRDFGVISEIEFEPCGGFNGYIYDDNIDDPPYFDPSLEFPRHFKTINSTNALFVTRELSDAYTNVFAFLDSDTNMFLSARLLV